MKKLMWSLITILVMMVAIGAVTGHRVVLVDGGSMAPTYANGDVLITRAPSGADLELGTVVTVGVPPAHLRTHRVIDLADAGAILKGDANTVADPGRITEADVFAVPIFHITGLWAPIVRAVTFPVTLAGLAILFLISALWPRRRTATRETEHATDVTTSPEPADADDLAALMVSGGAHAR